MRTRAGQGRAGPTTSVGHAQPEQQGIRAGEQVIRRHSASTHPSILFQAAPTCTRATPRPSRQRCSCGCLQGGATSALAHCHIVWSKQVSPRCKGNPHLSALSSSSSSSAVLGGWQASQCLAQHGQAIASAAWSSRAHPCPAEPSPAPHAAPAPPFKGSHPRWAARCRPQPPA